MVSKLEFKVNLKPHFHREFKMNTTLFQVLLNEQKTGYVVIDHNFSVLEYAGNLTVLISPSNSSTPLQIFDIIPELSGCETILEDILNGISSRFNLENINRTLPNKEIYYLSLVILRYVPTPNSSAQLLAIITDTTSVAQTEQVLTQQRNELSLLKHNLNDTNQRLEHILQYYIPREVGNALMENRIIPQLGGEEREITILFADLRNYTSISENLTPNETIEMLHVCLDIATTAIAEAGGVIINYMGDAVMAIFNAPDEQLDHARRAVQAGLTMQAMTAHYRSQAINLSQPLHFGVGINTGIALVGNIGAQWYYQYTAVGDTINVASRICSHALANEVLIGANTYNHIQDLVTAQVLSPLKFKGKSQKILVYQVTALNGNSLIKTLQSDLGKN